MTNGNDLINETKKLPNNHGLTKREYFAAMAMQRLCLNGAYSPTIHKQCDKIRVTTSTAICIYAIDLADELIKQLNENK